MDVIELHITTEDREADIGSLAEICEARGFDVVRLFWRGLEPDDDREDEQAEGVA